MLQYTGGTTGTPKGAELTHANLYVNAMQVGRWFHGCKPGQERILGVLPLFHVFGMTTVMNAGLQLGAELILLPRFEIEQLMRTIHRKRPTIFPAVPTMFTAITRYEARSRYDLSSIEICISGGAPLPARGQAAVRAADRLHHRRGLWPDRGLAGGVHATRSTARARPARSACRCRGTMIDIVILDDGRTPCSRAASAARSACAARR